MVGVFTWISILFHQITWFVALVKNQAFAQPLSEAEESENIRRCAQGDEHAKMTLIEHNLRLVAHVVKKFSNTKQATEDLISIGTIGLIKAIDSYSPDKGTKLATFAARCIENEILMHLRAIKKTKNDVSLQDPLGTDAEGNEMTLLDVLGTDPDDIPHAVHLNVQRSRIQAQLEKLDVREQDVIRGRFGLYPYTEELTQRDLAVKLGISRSYVSRIEKRALLKLYREFYPRP